MIIPCWWRWPGAKKREKGEKKVENSMIFVRPAGENDTEIVVNFNAAMARESEGKELDRARLSQGVRGALSDDSKCRYFVAEVEGRVVGQTMVTFEWSDWRNGDFWWIQSVYVDPAFRRRGVFRALHEHIRRLARSTPGVCGLRLYVHRDNVRAQKTYRELGMPVSEYLVCEEDWSEGRN
jgi:ribosomal protein S18 acetylase RimI-like enzyme